MFKSKSKISSISYGAVLAFLSVLLFTAACQKDGAMERAGEKTDEAIKDAGRTLEDAAD